MSNLSDVPAANPLISLLCVTYSGAGRSEGVWLRVTFSSLLPQGMMFMLTHAGTLRSLRALGFARRGLLTPTNGTVTSVTVRRRSPVFGLPGLLLLIPQSAASAPSGGPLHLPRFP